MKDYRVKILQPEETEDMINALFPKWNIDKLFKLNDGRIYILFIRNPFYS